MLVGATVVVCSQRCCCLAVGRGAELPDHLKDIGLRGGPKLIFFLVFLSIRAFTKKVVSSQRPLQDAIDAVEAETAQVSAVPSPFRPLVWLNLVSLLSDEL